MSLGPSQSLLLPGTPSVAPPPDAEALTSRSTCQNAPWPATLLPMTPLNDQAQLSDLHKVTYLHLLGHTQI